MNHPRILNNYLARVTSAVMANGGYLDKIMGDGFMAIFNAEDQPDHATNAVRCAVQMHKRLAEWNKEQVHQLNLRIGIHTGDAVIGNVGTEELMNYTAIGDTVNLAKRLEEAGQAGGTLISGDTYRMLDLEALQTDRIQANYRGPGTLKGRATPVDLYEIWPYSAP
ncbi:adenylate/guanylate cyclase domain-containing protein [Chloroflexi bacterium TSY]|nr:adenylate/guanylate cyclase domain-containing protein [Chloroflexi bacterium TSY]